MRFYLLLLLPFFLFACGADPAPEATSEYDVQLFCEAMSDTDQTGIFAVYAVVDENKVKISTLPACQTISVKEQSHAAVPKNALQAVISADGSAIYVAAQEDKLAFYLAKKEQKTLIAQFVEGRYQFGF
ncbi:MAG TPA: hypothetical protein PKA00_19660 [Saprospiraceae bacterium]|nr:hypothetical protein [Saprospiraceae bacterium]HMQ85136.1 hypothetical protein [Saprospiraceae bacterium]